MRKLTNTRIWQVLNRFSLRTMIIIIIAMKFVSAQLGPIILHKRKDGLTHLI